MKKLIGLTAVSALLMMSAVTNVHAVSFTISNDAISLLGVDPISSAMTASEYFNYSGVGKAEFGPATDTGYFWLYENTLTGDLSLNVMLDKVGSGTTGSAMITFAGLPDASSLELSNDCYELKKVGSDSFLGNWRWKTTLNDGGIIAGVEHATPDYQFTVNVLSSIGINSWYFLSGDPLAPTQIALDMTKTLVISDPTAVPEPSTLLLLGAGLLGAALTKRKRTPAIKD